MSPDEPSVEQPDQVTDDVPQDEPEPMPEESPSAETPPADAPPEPTYALQEWAGLPRYVCLICGWGSFDYTVFKPHMAQAHGAELILAEEMIQMIPEDVRTASGMPPTVVTGGASVAPVEDALSDDQPAPPVPDMPPAEPEDMDEPLPSPEER